MISNHRSVHLTYWLCALLFAGLTTLRTGAAVLSSETLTFGSAALPAPWQLSSSNYGSRDFANGRMNAYSTDALHRIYRSLSLPAGATRLEVIFTGNTDASSSIGGANQVLFTLANGTFYQASHGYGDRSAGGQMDADIDKVVGGTGTRLGFRSQTRSSGTNTYTITVQNGSIAYRAVSASGATVFDFSVSDPALRVTDIARIDVGLYVTTTMALWLDDLTVRVSDDGTTGGGAVNETLTFGSAALPAPWQLSPSNSGSRDFANGRMNAYSTDALHRIYRSLSLPASATRLEVIFTGNTDASSSIGGANQVLFTLANGTFYQASHGYGDRSAGGQMDADIDKVVGGTGTRLGFRSQTRSSGTNTYTITVQNGSIAYRAVSASGATVFDFSVSDPALRVTDIARIDVGLYVTTTMALWLDDLTVRSSESSSPTSPVVSTASATSITESSATLGGTVTSDGGAVVTQRGVVYGLSSNPTTANATFVVGGSGTGSFSVSSGTLTEGTTYYVRAFATNSVGTAYGENVQFATRTAPQGTVSATQSSGGYTPGNTATINISVSFTASLTSLGYRATIPAGWSYAGGTNEPGVRPAIGQTGTLDWAWTSVPSSPASFSFSVNAPAGASGAQIFSGAAVIRSSSSSGASEVAAMPNPLSLSVVDQSYHSADTNRDRALSLTELTRVIELFNTLNGTARTGEYRTQAGTEDGFAPGPGPVSVYHSADTNRDGRLSLTELTRVIELFNTLSGTSRTGQYHIQSGTEDGFAPGS